MSSAVAAVTGSLSKLNPFGKSKEDKDDEKGEALEFDSVGTHEHR